MTSRLSESPSDAHAHARLGVLAFEAEAPDVAAAHFEAAARLAPDDASIATNLGHARLAAGEPAAAAVAYRHALHLSPRIGAAWFGLGDALRRRDEFADAAEAYRNAIANGVADAATYNGLGIALKEDGLLGPAEVAYRRALEMQPASGIYVNLGNVLGDQGRSSDAIAVYEAALALNPDSAEASFNLFAAVYDAAPKRGELLLERALRARPDFMPARFHLGALRALRGEPDGAREFLGGAPSHLLSSLEFVKEHMGGTRLFTDGFRLLDAALSRCCVDGAFLELGVRRGTSINFIAERAAGCPVHGFDSFEGLPTEWGAMPKGAYSTKGEVPEVRDNVVLHAGWFKDTCPRFVKENPTPIRFMNIDCDLYSSTRDAFDAFGPHLSNGTVLVFDEYLGNPGWEGEEHRALIEAAEEHAFSYDFFAVSLFTRQAAVVVRKSG